VGAQPRHGGRFLARVESRSAALSTWGVGSMSSCDPTPSDRSRHTPFVLHDR
jgi:hypothetical protein